MDDVPCGEAHFIEEVDAAEQRMRKVAELIVAPVAKPPSARRQSHGLHRLIPLFMHVCTVVARDRGCNHSMI
jgi:hypothetical protein